MIPGGAASLNPMTGLQKLREQGLELECVRRVDWSFGPRTLFLNAMRSHFAFTRWAACSLVLAAACAAAEPAWSVKPVDTGVEIRLDGELFTAWINKGMAKPVLYPVIGPTGAALTRHYPMRTDVAGEATDHPHHRSIWFTHGSVNGQDFWTEGAGKGTIVPTTPVKATVVPASGDQRAKAVVQGSHQWVAADGKVQCTDDRVVTCSVLPDGSRTIDYEVTLHASAGELKLGETKEGLMGMRLHPGFELVHVVDKKTSTPGPGHILNSEGDRDAAAWGKRAKWVAYWGPVEGQTLGVAMFDHPANPRHPSPWHARDYGLLAANPLGGRDFDKKLPKGTGDWVVPAGSSVTFRYRIVLHRGDAQQADIAGKYQDFAAGR